MDGAVDRDLRRALQDMGHGVTGRGMGADALSGVKGEEGHPHAGALGQGQADHLPCLVGHLLLQGQGLGVLQMLDQLLHFVFSFIICHLY